MLPAHVLTAVTPEELTRAASVFSSLKQLRLRLTPDIEEAKLDNAFEAHVTGVLGRLDGRLASFEGSPDMKKIEIIMARHGLYDAAFQQAILLGSAISPALGDALKDIRFIHSGFMAEMHKVGQDFYEQIRQANETIEAANNEVNTVENECKKLIQAADLLDQEADAHEKEILELRAKLRSTSTQFQQLSMATTSDTGISPLSPFAISQRTTGQVFDTKITPVSISNVNNIPPLTRSLTSSSSKYNMSSTGSITSDANGTASKASNKTAYTITPEYWLFLFRTELQKSLDNRNDSSRTLSFNETIELINKFYESKKILNSKCSAKQSKNSNGLVSSIFETMEQHVYHTYEKRYGLRSLALEHCSMFISALEMYSKSEANLNNINADSSSVDVQIFSKVFKNELDEAYHDVHLQLHKSIRDLIVLHIINRYPNKTHDGVQELLQKKLAGVINTEEWTDIVNYLYNGSDARSLIQILRTAANNEVDSNPTPPAPGSPHLVKANAKIMSTAEKEKEAKRLGYMRGNSNITTSTNKMSYSAPEKTNSLKLLVPTFLFCVCSFQLQSHEVFISKFIKIFHKHDNNADGIITLEQFKYCYGDIKSLTTGIAMDINHISLEKEFTEIIDIIDPNQMNIITFSNAAACLNASGGLSAPTSI